MPDAKTVLQDAAAEHGWNIRVLPAIPGEEGYVELRGGFRNLIVLRAMIPLEPIPGYDPWDDLLQSMYLLTR